MEAGRAFQITAFDTQFARYAWSRFSEQEGRFDVINGDISVFHWYDSNDIQTVDTGITITIDK